MSNLKKLKAASSIFDLAALLGYQPHTFTYLLYSNDPKLDYVQFEIPKKSGGSRVISKPCEKIMALQRKLANLLSECEFELGGFKKNLPSHGFVKNRSIYTNAVVHRNKRFVLNIDLEDFFGSINFGRVRGFFMSNRNYLLHESVATAIAKIVCHQNKLPQGSPVSPVISNIIGNILDVRISHLAKKNKFSYTRYVDDITLSSNQKDIPADIAYEVGKNNWHAGIALEATVRGAGFKINHKKTRLQYLQSRREVTGLSVGFVVNTKVEYRRKARAMVDSLVKNNEYYDGDNKFGREDLGKLRGMLAFISSIDNSELSRRYGSNAHAVKVTELTSRDKTFRKFIAYEFFAGNKLPTLIFEGKTDDVYLKCAIEKLSSEVTGFLKVDKDWGGFNFGFRTFKSGKTNSSLFGYSGGGGDLKNFLLNYEKYTSEFSGNGGQFSAPVIIVLDDDDGASGIKSIIKSKLKDLNDFMIENSYCNFVRNLYVLLIPKKGCAIEDLFDEKLLSEKLNGKIFNKNNKGGSISTEYGKNHFAEYVVKKKKNEINFDGFIPLIDKINEIISFHNMRSDI